MTAERWPFGFMIFPELVQPEASAPRLVLAVVRMNWRRVVFMEREILETVLFGQTPAQFLRHWVIQLNTLPAQRRAKLVGRHVGQVHLQLLGQRRSGASSLAKLHHGS